MVQSVYSAVGPLNALGLTSSYQNEGSAWETNWQEGTDHHTLLSRIDLISSCFLHVSSLFWLQIQPAAADQTEIRSQQLYVYEMVFLFDLDPVR